MKKLLSIVLVTLLGGLIVLPRPIRAQDTKKDKKEKTMTIKSDGDSLSRVYEWADEDGNKMIIDIDVDMDDMENCIARIKAELKESGKDMDEQHMIIQVFRI